MEPDLEIAEALRAVCAVHFDQSGACDYAALAGSRERGRLAACLAELFSFDPKRVRIGAQTAFWINVFNAALMRDSPELELARGEGDFQEFFGQKRLKVFGHVFSLDDIYHGLLRGNLAGHGRLRAPMSRDDPRLAWMPIAYDERIHFAMHTATRSSPPLRAFDAGALDVQLEATTGAYIRSSARVEQDGAMVVAPRILQWYAKDFGGEQGVVRFVAGHLGDEDADRLDRQARGARLRYTDYDWSLNRR